MNITRKFLDSPNAIYIKTGLKSASGLNLRSSEWAVFTQVDGKKSLQEIADTLAMTLDDVSKIVVRLFENELIDIFAPRKREEKFAGEDFFINLEKTLTAIVGPVAPYVIEDMLTDLDYNRNRLPAKDVAELVENISEEISDEEKKIEFLSQMLETIKKLVF